MLEWNGRLWHLKEDLFQQALLFTDFGSLVSCCISNLCGR